MDSRRYLAALTLAAAAWGAARDARAVVVEGHMEPGALIARGFTEIDKKPTFGADVNVWWSPLRHLDIGLETGGSITMLPFGQFYEEASLGERGSSDALRESPVLLPRAMFGARVVPLSGISVGAFAGASWLVSGPAAEFAFVPHPSAGVAVQAKFGPGKRYGVRAAVNYIRLSWGGEFVMPTIAFTWGSWEKSRRPSCDEPVCH
jgi:hypothetical protein